MLNVTEFETRLNDGLYKRQADARRAAFHLAVSETVRARLLAGVDRYFGKPFVYAHTNKQPSERARNASPNAWRDAQPEPMQETKGPLSTKLGEAILAKQRLEAKRRAASKGGKRRQELIRQGLQSGGRARNPIQARLALPEPAPIPAPAPTMPAPPAPVMLIADVKSEADRMVRELTARMTLPPPVAPPMPAGADQAFKAILDSTRELFEVLVAEAKEDERLRPDVLRVARAASQLTELGIEIVRDRIRPPTHLPLPPPSTEALGEAAQ